MHAGRATSTASRWPALLLAVLVGLCLVAGAGPVSPTNMHLASSTTASASVAATDAVVALRSSPQRLVPLRAPSKRTAPLGTAATTALLVALLLALYVRRGPRLRTSRAQLRVTAGRDPPTTS